MIDQEFILQKIQEQLREILDKEGLEDVPVWVWQKYNPYISEISFSIPIVKEEQMEISDYKFEIGDEVITVEGVKGKIVDICHCTACEGRGFPEPVWVRDDDKSETWHYITITDARIGFLDFYKIGKYRFNDFDKGEVLREMAFHEDMLKELRRNLRVIEEVAMEE